MPLSDAEELEFLRLKKRKSTLGETPQNVAHETGSNDASTNSFGFHTPDATNSALTETVPGKFLTGMGGEIVNMGRGAVQSGIDALSTIIDPNTAMEKYQGVTPTEKTQRGATPGLQQVRQTIEQPQQALRQGVEDTRKVQAQTGLPGAVGAFTAQALPWMAGNPSISAGVPAAAAQGFTTAQGHEDLDRTSAAGTNAAVGAAAPVAIQFIQRFIPGNISGILKKSLSTVLDLDKGAQERVFGRAQDIIDEGQRQRINLTGPEALQQAMEEHGIGGTNRLGTMQRIIEQSPSGEGQMARVIGPRSSQVENAGQQALRDTFGAPASPEAAVQNTQRAGEDVMSQAVKGRTDTTQPRFAAARTEPTPAAVGGDLEQLKKDLDAEIALTGPDNSLGLKLKKYRDLLDQGAPQAQPPVMVNGTEVPPGTPMYDALVKGGAVQPPTSSGPTLGPLIETNRTYAENLYKKYNPLDPENTFNNREVAALAPFNKRLQNILEGASPEYSQGLSQYRDISKHVINPLEEGPIGRIVNQGGDKVGARLDSLSNEFLSEDVRPGDVRKLAGRLNAIDPKVVPELVGSRLENMFTQATQDLQNGPNPWGGAKFITQVMGNSTQRANLEATIKSLPDGHTKWAAWNKLATVLKTTGKRKPMGSETAMNIGLQNEIGNVPLKFSANPIGWADSILSEWATKRNGAELARIFTDPQAARQMQKLVSLPPTSPKARFITAGIISTLQANHPTDASATTLATPPDAIPAGMDDAPGALDTISQGLQNIGNTLGPASAYASTNTALDIPEKAWAKLIEAQRPELMVGKSYKQIMDLRKNERLARPLAQKYFSGQGPSPSPPSSAKAPNSAIARPTPVPPRGRGGGDNLPSWVDAVEHSESGGRANAKAKTSSALGSGQFIANTWLDLMKRHEPELTKGKSRDQILALRTDRDLSRQMMYRYGQENIAQLEKSGFPGKVLDNPVVYKLAHFLGPGEIKALLSAKIGTPVERIFKPATINSNRRVLSGKKAEDVLYWAKNLVGNLPEPAAGPRR